MRNMSGPVDGLKTIVYVGKSMYPLLRDLDILYYEPYTGGYLKAGDVIVFMPSDRQGKTNITHRIISITPDGVVTKGDNNPSPDIGYLKKEEIVGFVKYSKRGNRFIKIYGGIWGRIFSSTMRVYLTFKRLAMRLLVWPYNIMARSGICRVFVPARMKPRIVSFKQPEGMESRLLMGKRVIGKLSPRDKNWIIYPPYKLFVNETNLTPKNNHSDNNVTSCDKSSSDDA
jgi:signal peptidase I